MESPRLGTRTVGVAGVTWGIANFAVVELRNRASSLLREIYMSEKGEVQRSVSRLHVCLGFN